MKVTYIIFSLILCSVYGQEHLYTQFTHKDDLPGITFYKMLENENGFIWLAADRGLYRYDGYSFKLYSHPKQKGKAVFDLKIDENKKMWFTNVSGQFFYVKNDSLHLFYDLNHQNTIPKKLYRFEPFHDNLIINGLYRGIFKINSKSKNLSLIDPTSTSDIIKTGDSLLLAQYENGYFYKSYLKGSTKKIRINKKLYEDPHFNLFKFKGTLFSFKQKGKEKHLLYNINKKKPTLYSLPKELKNKNLLVTNIIDNYLWFFTENGVYICDVNHDENSFQLKKHLLPNKTVTYAIKDHNKNYWFSTLHNGIYVIPNIEIMSHFTDKEHGTITEIAPIKEGLIAMGTTLGKVILFNTQTSSVKKIIELPSKRKISKLLFNQHFNDLYISPEIDRTSYIYDLSSGKLSSVYPNGFNGAKSLKLIDSSKLFLLFLNSASIIKAEKGKIKNYQTLNYLNKRPYESHYCSNTKQTYILYIDALMVYDSLQKGHEIKYKNKPIYGRNICETKDGHIWVATFNDGIIKIKNKRVVSVLNKKNTLPTNQISKVYASEEILWIITTENIIKFNTKTNEIQKLSALDGINSFNINGFISLGKDIWFSSNLGLFSFNKNRVFKKKDPTNPYFTHIEIDNEIFPPKHRYSFSQDKSKISFHFNTNGYKSSENINYEYKMSKIDSDWNTLTKQSKQVTYNRLPEGVFEFQLRTKLDNNYSDIQSIKIQVKGLFYEQWWFILILVSLLVFGIVYYYRGLLHKQKLKQLLKYEKQQNEMEKIMLKLENLRSQMNPHFVFNALNSIQDFIITNKKDLAGDYLGEFADLIREYLKQSTSKEISLKDEISTLNKYLDLEKLRFEEKLNYEINVSESICSSDTYIPTMLIQPFVENSIKHGILHKKNKGNIFIDFTINETKNKIICCIKDDGIGRERSLKINKKKPHQSFAFNATYKRLKLLNHNKKEKIAFEIHDLHPNLEDKGTLVRIEIPI